MENSLERSLKSYFSVILTPGNPVMEEILAYAGSMLYAIPSLLDIYTIDAHSIHFQFKLKSSHNQQP